MSFDPEAIKLHIPYYLAENDKTKLVKELESIGSGCSNYTLTSERQELKDSMLQGDCWSNFKIYSFIGSQERQINALILSNSCDIDPNNTRDEPSRVMYAPIAKLSTYTDLLKKSGLSAGAIESKLSAIRRQLVTTIFYIPAGGDVDAELIVRFDHATSAPINMYNSVPIEKRFTLNQTGFYLLALKLSVHFCRLHEDVAR
ncbi:hypothetical protein [Maricaulis maris]|uniref:hypothetical protein n=1 Tax=Maricaulis maris TaxID=74318 RepID=UPI003A9117F9